MANEAQTMAAEILSACEDDVHAAFDVIMVESSNDDSADSDAFWAEVEMRVLFAGEVS